MKSDAQIWILLRQLDRFVAGRLIDHQAGARQDSFAMGADDGLVDGGGAPEIVRIDNQAAGALRKFHNLRRLARRPSEARRER